MNICCSKLCSIKHTAFPFFFKKKKEKDQVANPELTDKSFQNRVRGFAAGMASGITKLAVGHPFGKLNL